MVHAYIDVVLLINKNDFKDHLNTLEKVLLRLAEARFKVNSDKSYYGLTETEYLGFWIGNKGVIPIKYIVEAINSIYVTTKVRDVSRFVVLVNYYRDMWRKRAHTLSPLTKICL